MTLRVERHDLVLAVLAEDLELLRYAYRPETDPFESPKPYLHPVRTLAGDVVTGYRPHDHRWHKGIQMTASHLSGENFWGGGSYVRGEGYLDLPNVGSMRHRGFTELIDSGDRISLVELLDWHTQTGARWVEERRSIIVGDVVDGSWSLDFATSLHNVRGEPLSFGSPATNGREQAGYTGLFWRGPRAFTGGTVLAAGGQGGPEMMGRRARWLAYVGRHDEVDRASTLLFVDGPDNQSAPTHWFVRNEPFPAVNPSFAFHQEVTLHAGETLDLRYRLVVADAAWDRSRLESYLADHPW